MQLEGFCLTGEFGDFLCQQMGQPLNNRNFSVLHGTSQRVEKEGNRERISWSEIHTLTKKLSGCFSLTHTSLA